MARMDIEDRRKLLEGWAHSRLGVRRAGFQALKRLTNIAYYCWPHQDDSHPTWSTVGYAGPLPQPEKTLEPLVTVSIDRDTTLECDVVIVGSGAGGGVVAGILSEAGQRVVVLEKGKALGSRDMTQVEGEMLEKAYLEGGLLMTQSGSMPILAGSCLGGGTVINYTTSFALPDAVREEWNDLSELSLFTSSRFSESLARVKERLNVGTRWSTPGTRDELMERGLKKLGWHSDVIPRNVTDCQEGKECGYCGYGCRHGAKNDTARTYLRDAVASDARLITGCSVIRVLKEGGRAAGVVGNVALPDGRSVSLTVRARIVVAACGSINTPALLARSNLSNSNIGKGLRLHPASAVMGIFPDPVEPWSGALQTRYSEQFANLDDGYGVRFETAPLHLALPASAFGWEGAGKYRDDINRLKNMSLIGLLLRDRDHGRVAVTRSGRPRVHYDMSKYDAAHMHRGLLGGAEVLAAAGATEVFTLHSPPVRANTSTANWLKTFGSGCRDSGYRHNRMSYITFHQMASASMGKDPKKSVVGETGETHELPGLYIADASIFPTSSGVNPMITIMALADHIANRINEASSRTG